MNLMVILLLCKSVLVLKTYTELFRGNRTSCLQLTLNWFRKKYNKNKLCMCVGGGEIAGREREGMIKQMQ